MNVLKVALKRVVFEDRGNAACIKSRIDDLDRELNAPLRITTLVHEGLTEALNRRCAERHSGIFMLLQEERAGVDIAVPAEEVQQVPARG